MSGLVSDREDTELLRSRQRCIQELEEFTESCRKTIHGLFEALGWCPELNAIQEPMMVCPYDSNHRIPARSLEKHVVSCRLSKMGYSRDEQADMYDSSVFYEKAGLPCVIVDEATQRQVILQARANAPAFKTDGLYSQSEYSANPPDVPQNHKRMICDLTVADRLALFDHVIREAGQRDSQSASNEDLYVDLVAKLQKDDGQKGPKSHLEVLAEIRDHKRRRQSYRAKNVHITKKSYTEVIRDVISVHCGELARLWQEEERTEEESHTSERSSHRRKSVDKRSGSADSRQSHSSSRATGGSRRPSVHHRERDGERRRSSRDRDRERKYSRDGERERRWSNRDWDQERSRDAEHNQEHRRDRKRSRERGREERRRSREGSWSKEHRKKRESRSPTERHHSKKSKR